MQKKGGGQGYRNMQIGDWSSRINVCYGRFYSCNVYSMCVARRAQVRVFLLISFGFVLASLLSSHVEYWSKS